MAELMKKMDTMPANFINNDHQAGISMITESIQPGELHEFTWDEVAAYYWDNANLWDQPELASDLE